LRHWYAFSWRSAGLDVVFVKGVEDSILALDLVSCGREELSGGLLA
jgi:hypothetical protein